MKSYTHFTLNEREYLEEKLKEGKSIRFIAEHLGRSPSTVSREIKRNWSKKAKRYNSWHAQTNYIHRRKRCHRKNNLLYSKELFEFVKECLLKFWSPELVALIWNANHTEKISYNSIYRAVKSGLFKGIKPSTHFRRRGKKYSFDKKTSTPHPESSIHNRPICIDNRERFGDFEGDTVYGSVGKGYLITAIDRKSRLLVATIAKDKTKESTASALTKALKIANKSIPVHTLTLDNGTEFALYKSVEQSLGIKVYFADNHSPWQRGANENINGLIRFFFPRGTNFNNVSDEYLQYVIELINNRPRKCLGLLSPLEFINSCVALGLTI